MFRVTGKDNTDSIGSDEAEVYKDAGYHQRSSQWRPALRRFKNGLFSSKRGLSRNQGYTNFKEDEDIHPPHYAPTNQAAIPTTCESQQFSTQDRPPTERQSAKLTTLKPPSGEKPKGPREPQDPKSFKFIKRTFSKRRKDSTAEIDENPINETVPNVPAYIPTERPISVYVPKHAATDFSKSTTNNKLQKRHQTPSRPATAACVPLHAATDFSQMNLPSRDNPWSAIHSRNLSLDLSRESMDGSRDYQDFLAASRRVEERDFINRAAGPKMFYSTPETSRALNEITTNHHRKASSISQRSNISKRSRTGSFIEKIGEYIKPSRPESVHNRAASLRDERGSVRDSIDGTNEKRDGRWARASGSIRRSFSRERDGEADREVADGRTGWNGRRRRKKLMPLSRGLDRYNQAVSEGYR